MKLAFLVLLLLNLAVFAWQRGIFGPVPDSGREPQRASRQIAPESIRLLTPEQAAALRGASASAGAAKTFCFTFGDFDETTAARVQARLAALQLGDRLQSEKIEVPEWFVVYLPPLPSRAEAERAAQDLRARGIRDLVVAGDGSALQNAILLGSFRDRELAQRHVSDLERRGVKGVRVSESGATAVGTRFEIRDADAAKAQQLADIQKEFPQGQLGACAN